MYVFPTPLYLILQINKMTTHNLGVVFGPTLIKSPPHVLADPMAMAVDSAKLNAAITLLISEASSFFGQEAKKEIAIPDSRRIRRIRVTTTVTTVTTVTLVRDGVIIMSETTSTCEITTRFVQ